MIFIPPKDIEHCAMNFFDTKTGENLGQIEEIKEVNMASERQIDYRREKHGNILTQRVHDTTYELTFNTDKPIEKENFYKILCVDMAKMPDAYTIQFVKFVEARKHKKRRINKKWLKRYGYKQMIVESKGWKIKSDTDGNIEFIK